MLMGTTTPLAGAPRSSVSRAVKKTPTELENRTPKNRVLKGGIARRKTTKNEKTVTGTTLRAESRSTPKVSAQWYRPSKGLDRAKDTIAGAR